MNLIYDLYIIRTFFYHNMKKHPLGSKIFHYIKDSNI